jgi:hypothetical protein
VTRGEPVGMRLTVHNSGRLPSATLVAEDRCGDRSVPVPLLRLRAGRETTVDYPVPTHRRGLVPVGPLWITRRDPLGLVVLARPYGPSTPVWVYPRVHPLDAVPTGVTRSLDGRVDRVPHGSITFDSLREYVVGDELRRVHWRTSARVGELMVREHLDTSLPRLVVLLDNRAEAHPAPTDATAQAGTGTGTTVETFESGCEAAASIVTAAYRDDLPVILLMVAAEPADGPTGAVDHPERAARPGRWPLRGRRRRPARAGAPDSDSPTDGSPTGTDPTGTAGTGPLDRLAAVGLVAGDPAGALRRSTNRLRQERLGDTLVFLTGPGGRADLGQLDALRGGYPSVVAGVFGAAGSTPPGAAGLTVIDAADGAEFAAEWDGVRRW